MSQQQARSFAIDVVARLQQAGYQALWAGGCVRDLLMGRVPEDYDVATNAHPQQVRQIFGPRKTLAVGESFGVIIVLGPDRQADQVEVATFRSDGNYLDGRHPESVRFSTPEEDAQRRDFTINGMFYDPLLEKVYDYVGGEEDLRAGVIRAIGNPESRIQEDKLRMLRAIRFATRFGFQLESVTFRAICESAEALQVVSQERITEELRKMLRSSSRAEAFRLLVQSGLLKQVLPELFSESAAVDALGVIQQKLSLQASDSVEVSLAIIFQGIYPEAELEEVEFSKQLDNLGRRLRLSKREISEVGWLIENLPRVRRAEQIPLCLLKPMLNSSNCEALLELAEVVAKVENRPGAEVKFCRAYLEKTPAELLNPPALVTGHDLIKQGVVSGPAMAEMLKAIRDAQLNEEIHTREEALKVLECLQSGES